MNEKTKIIAWTIGGILAIAIMYAMLGGISDHIQTGLERTQAGIQHARIANERAREAHRRIEESIRRIDHSITSAQDSTQRIEAGSQSVARIVNELEGILSRDRESLARIRAIIERTETESGQGQENE